MSWKRISHPFPQTWSKNCFISTAFSKIKKKLSDPFYPTLSYFLFVQFPYATWKWLPWSNIKRRSRRRKAVASSFDSVRLSGPRAWTASQIPTAFTRPSVIQQRRKWFPRVVTAATTQRRRRLLLRLIPRGLSPRLQVFVDEIVTFAWLVLSPDIHCIEL